MHVSLDRALVTPWGTVSSRDDNYISENVRFTVQVGVELFSDNALVVAYCKSHHHHHHWEAVMLDECISMLHPS